MELFLWSLGLLLGPPIAVFYVVYPRIINDAPWYGTFSEYMNLYMYPPFFYCVGVASGLQVFERLGAPWPYWLEMTLVVPGGVGLFVGFAAAMGVPMPRFLTPKWVRERRKQDREYKRQVKAERKAERRRRRAASRTRRPEPDRTPR